MSWRLAYFTFQLVCGIKKIRMTLSFKYYSAKLASYFAFSVSASKMTYIVSGWALNSTHWLTPPQLIYWTHQRDIVRSWLFLILFWVMDWEKSYGNFVNHFDVSVFRTFNFACVYDTRFGWFDCWLSIWAIASVEMYSSGLSKTIVWRGWTFIVNVSWFNDCVQAYYGS